MNNIYDISILIPAIRQNRWITLFDSLEKACKNLYWQLVLVSPFDLPFELEKHTNIKLIKDYGCVSRAVQIGMLNIDSPLVFVTVDDCVFAESSIDVCVTQYLKECNRNDAMLMRYKEGSYIYTAADYRLGHHDTFKRLNINQDWLSAPQFIINKDYFIELGGFDCRYEYMNEPVHDFIIRLHRNGGRVIPSEVHSCEATHYPGTEGDHAPVHNAQVYHDYPIFCDVYKDGIDYLPLKIPYDNWKNTPPIWERRYQRGIPKSYQELVQQENYRV